MRERKKKEREGKKGRCLLLEIVPFGDFNMWISVPTILPSHRVFSLLPEGAGNSADLFCSRNGLVLFGDLFFFLSRLIELRNLSPFFT